jgi:hypothetical protein
MSSQRFTLVLALLWASSALAQSEGHLEAKEADPTQATTLDIQKQGEAAKQGLGVTAHGVAYLSYVAPFDKMGGPNLLLLQGELRYDAETWGMYFTPRLKMNNPGEQTADSYIFFQQAYAFAHIPWGEVKLGKVYGRFGRFWDYGFYGPLLANDDLKLAPDLGVSMEGSPSIAQDWTLEYAVQYFAIDGRSWALGNASPVSLNRVRRTNIVTLRAAPTYHLTELMYGSVGLSAGRFNAYYSDNHQVLRGAVDLDVNVGPVSAFLELGRQDGVDIVTLGNLQVPSFDYVWTGIQVRYERVNARYHYNAIRYDNGDTESLHQPGVEVKITDNFSLMGEVAVWVTNNPTLGRGEKSFYLIAMGCI